MRRPEGYSEIFGPGMRTMEHDTANCRHCGRVMLVKPGFNSTPYIFVVRADATMYEREAGFCRKCYGYVCPVCDGKECSNFHARLDEREKVARKIICEGI